MQSDEILIRAVIAGDCDAAGTALQADHRLSNSRGAVEGLSGNPSALTIAARFGYLPIVQLLLDFGAAIDDAADPERIETALNIAANHGHAAVVESLMKRGANLNIHYTPAHWAWYAKPQRHQYVIDLVRRHFESLPLLRDAGPIETNTDEYSIRKAMIKVVSAIRVAFNATGVLNGPQEISAAYRALYEPMDHALAMHNCYPIGPNILAYTYEPDS